MFAHRVAVWRDTKDYSDCIPPPHVSSKFRWAPNEQWNKHAVGMKVSVKNVDCLQVCKELIDSGANPVVLNLADIVVPGGLVESGSGAQEESIFRRSNLCRTLTQQLYPCEAQHHCWHLPLLVLLQLVARDNELTCSASG